MPLFLLIFDPQGLCLLHYSIVFYLKVFCSSESDSYFVELIPYDGILVLESPGFTSIEVEIVGSGGFWRNTPLNLGLDLSLWTRVDH